MKKLFFVLLCAISLNTQANSCGGEYQASTGTCRIIGTDGREILYNSTIPQSDNRLPKKIIEHTVVHLPSKYGAIANDKKTGTLGGSENMDSESTARKAAIQSCQNGNTNASCKIVATYANGCIAAVGGKKKSLILFKAVHETSGGYALKKAMAKCEKFGASNCQVLIRESCSLP